MKHACAIFDLDGTLLDTLEDLRAAANGALEARGHAPRTTEEIRLFIGDGARKLIERAAPAGTPETELDGMMADFRALYDAAQDVRTRPYPGIVALLQRLRAGGVKVAVNSNKYDRAVQALCDMYFPGLYDFAVGEGPTTPKKPSPVGARAALAVLRVEAKDAVYIGDSAVDMETAKNAGLPFFWVSWGFRRAGELPELPPLRFDSAEALGDYILS